MVSGPTEPGEKEKAAASTLEALVSAPEDLWKADLGRLQTAKR
jgi:hypothetical protein